MEEDQRQIAPTIDKFSWYLAGLLDGEGFLLVQVNKNKTNFSPCLRIKIALMNKEALFKLREFLGIGSVYAYNCKKEKDYSIKSYQWYCSGLRDVKKIIELVEGKLLIKTGELEKFKKIVAIMERKRKERGIAKNPFNKEELSEILEIRDSMRTDFQRSKTYKKKEYFLSMLK